MPLYPLIHEIRRYGTPIFSHKVVPGDIRQKYVSCILIVEDSELGNNLIEALEMEGFVTILAINGVEGVQFAQKYQPDLIITDFMMPQMNGLQFIRCLSEIPLVAHIPIIMMSGAVNYHIQALEAGAVRFMAKPFPLTELMVTVRQVLFEYQAAPSTHSEAQTLL